MIMAPNKILFDIEYSSCSFFEKLEVLIAASRYKNGNISRNFLGRVLVTAHRVGRARTLDILNEDVGMHDGVRNISETRRYQLVRI